VAFTAAVYPHDADAARKKVRQKTHKVTKKQPVDATVRADRYAAIVIDAKTGQLLYGRDEDQVLYPASTTKMFTAYETFVEMRKNPDFINKKLPVSRYAATRSRTNLALSGGERIAVKDLLSTLLVHSANDAAVVLAEGISGSEEAFAARVNASAKRLGMKNTHFENPNGLPNPNHHSTVRDMAILARTTLTEFPEYAHYFNIQNYTYGGVTYKNYNSLLGKYPGVDCCKTGFTNASRFNLIASAKRGNQRIIGVIFGANTAAQRHNDMIQLLNFGFEKLQNPNATFTLSPAKAQPATGGYAPDPSSVDEEGGDVNAAPPVAPSSSKPNAPRVPTPSVAAPVASPTPVVPQPPSEEPTPVPVLPAPVALPVEPTASGDDKIRMRIKITP